METGNPKAAASLLAAHYRTANIDWESLGGEIGCSGEISSFAAAA
jgi:hypothetical protein